MHAEMTQDERKAFLKNVNKICPDQEAWKRCCNFKITSSSNPSASARQLDRDLSDLSPLSGYISKEEQASLLDKAKTVLYDDEFRQGFKASGTLWTVRDHFLTGCSALTMENVRVIARFLCETTFVTTSLLLPSI